MVELRPKDILKRVLNPLGCLGGSQFWIHLDARHTRSILYQPHGSKSNLGLSWNCSLNKVWKQKHVALFSKKSKNHSSATFCNCVCTLWLFDRWSIPDETHVSRSVGMSPHRSVYSNPRHCRVDQHESHHPIGRLRLGGRGCDPQELVFAANDHAKPRRVERDGTAL